MPKTIELPEIEFAEANNYVIKLSSTPRGATARFKFAALTDPVPIRFKIDVYFGEELVVSGEGVTPVELPFEFAVSRRTLLEYVGKKVSIKYGVNYGGNAADSPSATFEIQH